MLLFQNQECFEPTHSWPQVLAADPGPKPKSDDLEATTMTIYMSGTQCERPATTARSQSGLSGCAWVTCACVSCHADYGAIMTAVGMGTIGPSAAASTLVVLLLSASSTHSLELGKLRCLLVLAYYYSNLFACGRNQINT